MRVRLLIDVVLTPEDIALMQKNIGDQPRADVQFESGRVIHGRLMGATPVEVDAS